MLRCHRHTAVGVLQLRLALLLPPLPPLLLLSFFAAPTCARPATTSTTFATLQLQTTTSSTSPSSTSPSSSPSRSGNTPTLHATPVAWSASDRSPILLISNLVKLDAAPPATPPPYTPLVTPPPDQDARLAKMGYSLTTFYACNTIGGQEHCGWHVPVVKVEGHGPTHRTDIRVVLAVVTCMAGVFAWGLL